MSCLCLRASASGAAGLGCTAKPGHTIGHATACWFASLAAVGLAASGLASNGLTAARLTTAGKAAAGSSRTRLATDCPTVTGQSTTGWAATGFAAVGKTSTGSTTPVQGIASQTVMQHDAANRLANGGPAAVGQAITSQAVGGSQTFIGPNIANSLADGGSAAASQARASPAVGSSHTFIGQNAAKGLANSGVSRAMASQAVGGQATDSWRVWHLRWGVLHPHSLKVCRLVRRAPRSIVHGSAEGRQLDHLWARTGAKHWPRLDAACCGGCGREVTTRTGHTLANGCSPCRSTRSSCGSPCATRSLMAGWSTWAYMRFNGCC
mmetsp:Transcript_139262/g.388641  ORF Transcript_139262/g.388641 Transcript_139262/m.388641 type:complete len:322 (-) Transcript_139262:1150-2115(-)